MDPRRPLAALECEILTCTHAKNRNAECGAGGLERSADTPARHQNKPRGKAALINKADKSVRAPFNSKASADLQHTRVPHLTLAPTKEKRRSLIEAAFPKNQTETGYNSRRAISAWRTGSACMLAGVLGAMFTMSFAFGYSRSSSSYKSYLQTEYSFFKKLKEQADASADYADFVERYQTGTPSGWIKKKLRIS